MRIIAWLRGLALSVALGVGLWAVVHFEAPVENGASYVRRARTALKPEWRKMYPSPEVVDTTKASVSVGEELRQIMAEDEILGKNPFAELPATDVLARALSGVSAFERQTLRSPSYREEAGYDLVHYEILHGDGSLSQVLAYIGGEGGEASVVVMVLAPNGGESQSATYQDGDLIEVKSIPADQGDHLFAERLSTGVPFLSVSR